MIYGEIHKRMPVAAREIGGPATYMRRCRADVPAAIARSRCVRHGAVRQHLRVEGSGLGPGGTVRDIFHTQSDLEQRDAKNLDGTPGNSRRT